MTSATSVTSSRSGYVFFGCALITALSGCAETTEPAAPTPTTAAVEPEASTSTQLVEVTEGTNLAMALSPDGSQIAMSLQGVLFTMPVSGGNTQALTDYYQDVREPVYSPDGSQLIYYGYRNGNWDLWSVSSSGGEPEALTEDLFDDREPQYAPAGSSIAFSSDRSGNYDIWLLDRENDNSLTQLTDSSTDDYSPAYAPDGSAIAYAVTTGRNASEVHIIDLSTLESRSVLSEAGTISGLNWHQPDQLSYQLSGNSATALKNLTISNAETVVLSQNDDDVFPFDAHWHSDQTVYYTANGRIYQQTEGTPRDEVAFVVEFELERPDYQRNRRDHDDDTPRRALGISSPALSADGEWVTFAALGDLWLWQPATRTLSNITNSPFVARTPRWSPDGTRIAYISDQPAVPGAESRPGLWLYDIEGESAQRLDLNASGISGPSWSPDGSTIAAFTEIPGSPLAGQMVMINLRDSSTTPVSRPLPAQPVSWSADGEYLATTVLNPYSSRFREGVYQLAVTSPDGSETYQIEPVAHRNMTNAELTPDGRAMSYVQDGRLWQQELSETFTPAGPPVALTDTLADTPSWSSGGRFLVYMDADRMIRLDTETGDHEDITPEITWTPEQPDETWTLFVGRVFDGITDGYLEDVLITISGNRIETMTAGADPATADIDASEQAAFPGLFEMHAHLGETSEVQGRTWLAYGITSVRDPGAHPYIAKERQEMWDSGVSPGPRSYTTGFLTDGNRVYYSVAEGITSDAHLERALDRARRLELDFIKTYVRLPDSWQKRVVEYAHGIGIPTSSHELFPAVAHGMDHVEHIGGTSRRGFAPKVSGLGRSYDDVISLLAESGMGITPTAVLPGYAVIAESQPDLFTTPQFDAFYGERGRQGAAMIARMFGPTAGSTTSENARLLAALAQRDALVVSGTDSPFSPYGAGLHAELRLYALAGLTPQQVLATATIKAATAAGVEHDLGTLQAGKVADIVLVNGDPLADIADVDNVTMTIKNGRAYPLESLLVAPELD